MRLRQIIFGFALAPILVGASAALLKWDEREDCAVAVDGYRQAVAFASGGAILIEADRACAQRMGYPLELSRVRITLQHGSHRLSRIDAPRATFIPGINRVLMGATHGPPERGCLGQLPLLDLDLKLGRIRAPQGVYLDLSGSLPASCQVS